jgi:hypothetical protein
MINLASFGPLTEAALIRFEAQIGFALPADYRQFLREHDGGVVAQQVFTIPDLGQDVLLDTLFGIHNSVAETLTLGYWLGEYGEEIPEKTLLIGADPGGRFLMYVTEGDNRGIYYWDDERFFPQSTDEEGDTYFVADSFADFCDSLRDFTYVPTEKPTA